MSPRDLIAENCAVSTSSAEFAALTFDVCMQLVHGPGPAMAANERKQLLQLATAAVRMLGAAMPAPTAVVEQLRLRPAVRRYA
ncbi:hypothetical protein E7V67_006250 [[Empedobacter] haloabium]|uniref:TetR family transcriptional regulator n=1 Tax=[Empedobacter] haloabium TaxID=592317 RepID=A0ABZ1UQ71_9BURK